MMFNNLFDAALRRFIVRVERQHLVKYLFRTVGIRLAEVHAFQRVQSSVLEVQQTTLLLFVSTFLSGASGAVVQLISVKQKRVVNAIVTNGVFPSWFRILGTFIMAH